MCRVTRDAQGKPEYVDGKPNCQGSCQYIDANGVAPWTDCVPR
jgi:hypothetical protein